MPGKYIFYLTAERFSAYSWRNNRLADEHVFTNDEFGRQRFSEYLARVGNEPAYLLADMVEEDYRFDLVPHLIGPERSALFNRKLEQYYRNSPFRHALVQGRREEGRRDDRVLFSALTNPALISPWLDLMLQHSVAVAGVYSAPLISKRLIKDATSPHLLLISWQAHAGLRQTYFQNANISFSRLTPLAQGDDLAEKIISESARTLQYLNSLSLLPPDLPLEICIICGGRDRKELQARLSNTPSLRYVFADVQQFAGSLGFKEALTDSDATPLLLHVLGSSPLPNQYGTAEHTHYFSLRQVRQALNGLSLAVALLTVLAGAFYIWSTMEMERNIGQLASNARNLVANYQQITGGFPPTPTSAANMQGAVNLAGKLGALAPDPRRVLDPISRTLEAFPIIQVNGLTWHNTFNPDSVKPEYASATEPATAAAQAPQTPQPGVRPAPDHAAEVPFQVVFLQGEIVPFDNNYRRALDTINSFQEAIRKTGATVTALALPLDLRPQATVSSEAAAQGPARKATFALKLVWKPA